MSNCNKCGQEIDFKKLPNGMFCPTNPDGSDHWDDCKKATRKEERGPRTEFMGRTIDGVLVTNKNGPVMTRAAIEMREKYSIDATY